MSDDGVPVYAICLDRATDALRDAVHERLKEGSDEGWWHRFADLWIVRGRSASEWRDMLRPLVQGGARVLVLKIDVEDSGTWSFRGSDREEILPWVRRYL